MIWESVAQVAIAGLKVVGEGINAAAVSLQGIRASNEARLDFEREKALNQYALVQANQKFVLILVVLTIAFILFLIYKK